MIIVLASSNMRVSWPWTMLCRVQCTHMLSRWSTCIQGQTISRWSGIPPPICTQFSTTIPAPLQIFVPTEPDSCSLKSFHRFWGTFQRQHQCFGNRCRFVILHCLRIGPEKWYDHWASWSRAFAIASTTITTFAASFISIPWLFDRHLYLCFHQQLRLLAAAIPVILRLFSTFDEE